MFPVSQLDICHYLARGAVSPFISIVIEIFTSVLIAHKYCCKLTKFQLLIKVCWDEQAFSIHLIVHLCSPYCTSPGLRKLVSLVLLVPLVCVWQKSHQQNAGKNWAFSMGRWAEKKIKVVSMKNRMGLVQKYDGSGEVETSNLWRGTVAGCSKLWDTTWKRRECSSSRK